MAKITHPPRALALCAQMASHFKTVSQKGTRGMKTAGQRGPLWRGSSRRWRGLLTAESLFAVAYAGHEYLALTDGTGCQRQKARAWKCWGRGSEEFLYLYTHTYIYCFDFIFVVCLLLLMLLLLCIIYNPFPLLLNPPP